MSNGQSFLCIANNLLRDKRYHEALHYYRKFQEIAPSLADVVAKNIEMCTDYVSDSPFDYFENYNKSEAFIEATDSMLSLVRYEIPNNNVLVSIVMPVRNCSAIIRTSIESLLAQTYRNIEIVVVDDFSSDDTGNVVKDIALKDNRVKYYRLNANLGTYYARSYGIANSKGRYITIQDGDDVSHPERIQVHLEYSLQFDLDVSTSSYCRFSTMTGRINTFHGKKFHYGFITMFFARELIHRIGSFDLTQKGGDAEFSNRIRRFVSKNRIMHIPCTTYLAADMVGSLSYGEVDRNNINTKSALSVSRRLYSSNFSSVVQSINKHSIGSVFRFPMRRSPYNLPKGFDRCHIKEKVVGVVCTIPERKDIFREVLNNIVVQVDELFIYPDKYELFDLADFLFNADLREKVRIIDTSKYPGLRDGAKFVPLIERMYDVSACNVIYCTFDDDIYYPLDYVHSLYQRLLKNGSNKVYGVHGVIINEDFSDYRTDRKVYHFARALNNDVNVDVLGTGTVMFRADLLEDLFFLEDLAPGMIDLSLARVCRDNLITQMCISREHHWLKSMECELENSLYHELIENSTPHTRYLLDCKFKWGDSFINAISHVHAVDLKNENFSIDFINHNDFFIFNVTDNCVFRIVVESPSEEILNAAEVSVVNSQNGHIIFKKNTVDGACSFLLNSNSTRNFHLVFTGLEECEVKINFRKLFDNPKVSDAYIGDTAITASLATYPPRIDCLPLVLERMKYQVDCLNVYLNAYFSVPSQLSEIIAEYGRDRFNFVIDPSGEPKASGKFRWLGADGYVFILDDDIVYPEDYIEYTIGWIEKYNRKAFVGYHAAIFEETVSSFNRGDVESVKEKILFSKSLSQAKQVHLLGTGTLAFHSSLIKPYLPELKNLLFNNPDTANANDEALSVFAKMNNIPMYSLPRGESWIVGNKNMKYGIFEEHFNDLGLSDSVVKMLSKGNPWPKLL